MNERQLGPTRHLTNGDGESSHRGDPIMTLIPVARKDAFVLSDGTFVIVEADEHGGKAYLLRPDLDHPLQLNAGDSLTIGPTDPVHYFVEGEQEALFKEIGAANEAAIKENTVNPPRIMSGLPQQKRK